MGIFKNSASSSYFPLGTYKNSHNSFYCTTQGSKKQFSHKNPQKIKKSSLQLGSEDFILQLHILFTLIDKILFKFLFCKCIYVFEKIILKLIQPK